MPSSVSGCLFRTTVLWSSFTGGEERTLRCLFLCCGEERVSRCPLRFQDVCSGRRELKDVHLPLARRPPSCNLTSFIMDATGGYPSGVWYVCCEQFTEQGRSKALALWLSRHHGHCRFFEIFTEFRRVAVIGLLGRSVSRQLSVSCSS